MTVRVANQLVYTGGTDQRSQDFQVGRFFFLKNWLEPCGCKTICGGVFGILGSCKVIPKIARSHNTWLADKGRLQKGP